MLNDLRAVVKFAEHIRFSGDTLKEKRLPYLPPPNTLKNLLYCNELCISKEVTPELYSSFKSVLCKLGISENSVEAFVHASPDINAQCYSGYKSNCIIRFSSSLVDILNKNEFEFVVGHELGHFLLCHSTETEENNNRSIEFYIQQRAQEISADRVGLIGCDSIEIAIKALIKTISGLNDRHLRFDVGAFLSQLKKTTNMANQNNQSTHPSIIVRCRALLWFSLNQSYINNSKIYHTDDLLSLDKRVQNDLDNYVDGSFRKKIEDAKYNVSMWMAAFEIVQGGKFSKEDQVKFCNNFGKKILDKLIEFLNNLSETEIKSAVFEKLEEARWEMESLIPSSFESELKTLKKWS